MAGRSGLSINLEVIESMAAMATLEVPGVAAMAAKTVDIRNVIARRSVFKPVHAEIKNGAVVINLYITISKTANAKQVGEAVQLSVKDKVQSMTSNAVTKVNVNIAGVDLTEPNED
ncbi:MAG: Asp23/Gls24 family envelope stress response protein [Clostridia bacterium]|nr:Asp23/Gls24 family envelope stress response protein [Clostridia bacterium]